VAKDSSKDNDLTRSGRVNTVVETITVVEDRTEAPVERMEVEYDATHETVGAFDTVLTTYGEPVGGRPGEDEASA